MLLGSSWPSFRWAFYKLLIVTWRTPGKELASKAHAFCKRLEGRGRAQCVNVHGHRFWTQLLSLHAFRKNKSMKSAGKRFRVRTCLWLLCQTQDWTTFCRLLVLFQQIAHPVFYFLVLRWTFTVAMATLSCQTSSRLIISQSGEMWSTTLWRRGVHTSFRRLDRMTWQTWSSTSIRRFVLVNHLRQDHPLEAILVIFRCRALIFFLWKDSENMKNNTTFMRMRTGDYYGDTKMLRKGTSLRWIELFY